MIGKNMATNSENMDIISIYNELQEARQVMTRQQEELQDIYDSTCWKITKPYRVLGIAIKNTYKRVRSGIAFGFLSVGKCFKWVRQYGVKEGGKLIRERIQLKLKRKQREIEITTLAQNNNQWLEFEKWLDSTEYSFIDIFSVPMGWNTKLFQRFQHLSLNAGKIGGIAIYGAHPDVDQDVELYKFITPHLCIVNLQNPVVKQQMFYLLDKRKCLKYIRIQSIDLATTIQEIQTYLYKGYYIVYEYIDELTPQITGEIPQFVYDRHEFLLKNLRVITIATSDKLYAQAYAIRKSNVNMSVSTNGVDYDYWHTTKEEHSLPDDISHIVQSGKVIVGYHGALAKWIDYDALRCIALDGKYAVLLIGFEHDDSLKDSKILELENVYYIGPKPYEKLTEYAVWYDVAILPFALNNITLSVSPVKIFEYMALGKPIITSALPECKKYASCIIAENPEEYVIKLDLAMTLRVDKKYQKILDTEALENTWSEITRRTVELVVHSKENEEKYFQVKKEEDTPDVQNNSVSIQYKNRFINQVLDISVNRRSVYHKELTEKPYNRQKGDCKIIAYYLTQFHPDAHNEAWWGKGVTEWNNVVRAVPQFVGQYQPRIPGELGYYDLRIQDVMKRQIELAKMYGVYGFSFYYYWFNGERLLEQPLEMFLRNPELDFPFSLCWANENWTRRFDGTNTDILMEQPTTVESYKNVIYDMIRFLKDKRYIEINGKKVITVYRPSLMPRVKEVLVYWREKVRDEGLGELYLIAVKENMIDIDWISEGYDAVSEFHPGTLYTQCSKINEEMQFIRKDFAGEVFSYDDIVKSKKYFNYSYPKLYRAVMPMWDNTARRNHKGMIFHGSTPALYKEWLMDVIEENKEKKNVDENIVFINAWNEWGEGTYLEPDRFYGYAYLEATKEAVEESREL